MSELHRSTTPGPWTRDNTYSVRTRDPLSERALKGRKVAETFNSQDTLAIADLPDWIARCDELRNLLRESRSYVNTPFAGSFGGDELVARIDAVLGEPDLKDNAHARRIANAARGIPPLDEWREVNERCNELEALLPVVIAQREHLLKALKEVEQKLTRGHYDAVKTGMCLDGVRLDLANYDEIGRSLPS